MLIKRTAQHQGKKPVRYAVRCSLMVAPVCPKGAILLMPREMACAGMTAVVSDPNVIEEMNIWALCSELEFNSAFVAANRRTELE